MSAKNRGIMFMVLQCLGAALMICSVRYVSETLPSTVIVFFRNIFWVLWMLPWFLLVGRKKAHKPRWRMYLTRAVFAAFAMQCWFYALTVVPLSLATALSFSSPLISAVLAILIFKERNSKIMWASMLVGFCGVLVVLRPGTDAFSWAAMLVMLTATMWSISGMIIKSLTKTEHPIVVTFFMGMFMAPLSTPFLLIEWQMPVGEEWLWLIWLGLISTLFQVALAYAISSTDLVDILPFDFTRLIFVSVIAYFAFGEILDFWTVIGAIVIMGSTVIATHLESRKAKQLVQSGTP